MSLRRTLYQQTKSLFVTHDVSRHMMIGPPVAEGKTSVLRFFGSGSVFMSV